nr:MAG TPA: hypothetical protein [Caudoviricetes sp.]
MNILHQNLLRILYLKMILEDMKNQTQTLK